LPWKTWHERQVGGRASVEAARPGEHVGRGQFVSDIGSAVVGVFAFVVMLVVTVVCLLVALLFFLGFYNEWLIGILSTPPLPALGGVAIILVGGWGIWRVAAGRSLPGTPLRAKVAAMVTFIVIGVLGAILLASALLAEEPSTRF
jgi:hypothetical protein